MKWFTLTNTTIKRRWEGRKKLKSGGGRREEGRKVFIITFQRYEKYRFNVETLSYCNFADFYIFPLHHLLLFADQGISINSVILPLCPFRNPHLDKGKKSKKSKNPNQM